LSFLIEDENNGNCNVANDYDGDEKSGMAVYHEASGYWYVWLSDTGTLSLVTFGGPGYIPVGVLR